MRSKAAIGKHPIHPMLITLPIGLFTMSLVSDIVYLNSRQVFWYDMAWWTMAAGVVSALLAAIPGLVDYGTVARKHPDAKRIGMIHGLMNVSVVAVYALNLYLRNDRAATVGDGTGLVVGLSVACMIALGVSGWLGGRMVYRDLVGVYGEEEGDVRITMSGGARERIEH